MERRGEQRTTMTTIKDVAKRAGVSVSTASVALSGRGPVSEATRRRVLEAAKALDYRPNAIARSLVTRRTQTVGLVLSDITDPYFHEITKGVEHVLSAAGYALILADTDRSAAKERRSLEIFEGQRVAGIILAGSGTEDEAAPLDLKGDGIAVVTIGRHHAGLPFVAVDNVKAAGQAVAHLAETGARRIAFVAGPEGLLAAEERREGYLAALKERGLPSCPEWIVRGDFTPQGGHRAVAELLERCGRGACPKPDAILAANDQMAIGVLKGLKERGIPVPEEIAVAGIGGIPTGEFVDPPLTTVALPMKAMGEAAAGMLLEMIEGGRRKARPSVWLETHLLVRASTGAGRA